MKPVLSKLKKSLLFLLFTFLFLSTNIKSQVVYDTLYAFPDTTTFYNYGVTVVGDITNLAVKYHVDTTWESYQVQELLFSIPDGAIMYNGAHFSISVGDQPEEQILYTEQILFDGLSVFPEINKFKFLVPVSINNIKSFYVSGSIFFFLSISDYYNFQIPDQYAYWINTNEWIEFAPMYYNLKVVVKKNITDVEDKQEVLKDFLLSQNYPNPFNPTTNITYNLPKSSQIQLKVYNLFGEEVATLVNEYRAAGKYTDVFDGTGLPSSVYVYKIQAGDFVNSKKMLLLK